MRIVSISYNYNRKYAGKCICVYFVMTYEQSGCKQPQQVWKTLNCLYSLKSISENQMSTVVFSPIAT